MADMMTVGRLVPGLCTGFGLLLIERAGALAPLSRWSGLSLALDS